MEFRLMVLKILIKIVKVLNDKRVITVYETKDFNDDLEKLAKILDLK